MYFFRASLPSAASDSSKIIPRAKTSLHATLRQGVKYARRQVGRRLEQALIGGEPVTIISEDCWGGEFCRARGHEYTTPLAGAFINPEDYLNFLEHITEPDAFHLSRLSRSGYPMGRTPYATLHFMHARSWDEMIESFPRRVARMNPDRLFYKIDFGKAGYRQRDVERWNSLALPRAVAFLPPHHPPTLDLSTVHQGHPILHWTHDGAAMFHWSRRSFDFHHWIRTGRLRRSWWNRLLHFLFWDEHAPAETVQRWGELRRKMGAGSKGQAPPRRRSQF